MIVRSYHLISHGFMEAHWMKVFTYQGNEEEGKVEGDDAGDEFLEGGVFRFCL